MNSAAAVDTVHLPIYSPSQLDSWNDCPRKWGFDKIDRVPKTTAASAELGTAVHKVLEDWYAGKGWDAITNPRAADIAGVILPHLPAYGTVGMDIQVEAGFDKIALSERPHLWTGRIDLQTIGKPDPRNGLRVVDIYDHKTTSSIKDWAKSETDLRNDFQTLIYGKAKLVQFGGMLSHVNYQWTYGQTRNALIAKPVRLTLTREEIEEGFARVDALASHIDSARHVTTANQLPYNTDACDKYGGCGYRHLCDLTPRDVAARRNTIMANGQDALYNKLGAIAGGIPGMPQANPAAAIAPPPPAAPPGPPATMQPHEDMYGFSQRDGRGYVIADMAGNPLPPHIVESQHIPGNAPNSYIPIRPLTQYVAGELARHAAGYAAHLQASQPPAPVAPPPPPAAPNAGPGWQPGMVTPNMQGYTPPAQTGPVNPPEWQQPPVPGAVAPPPPPAAEEPAKRGPGRPKGSGKSKDAPAAPPPPPPGYAAPPAPPPGPPAQYAAPPPPAAYAPPPAPAPAPSAPSAPAVNTAVRYPNLTLFVGCAPVRGWAGNAVELDQLVLEANAHLKSSEGKEDYSFVPFEGGGKLSILVSEAVARFAAGHNTPVAVILDSRTREAGIVLSRLTPMAGTIVRGL